VNTKKWENIKDFLPQREPFLFVDELLTVSSEEIASRVTFGGDSVFAEECVHGGKYIPPHILLEALVQSGGAGLRKSGGAPSGVFVLASLRKVKIRGILLTPAVAVMNVKTRRAAGKTVKQVGVLQSGGKIILRASWTCVFLPAPSRLL
jgi:3-hydroxyacyl-[acyl-carrier-protein] dehydratase